MQMGSLRINFGWSWISLPHDNDDINPARCSAMPDIFIVSNVLTLLFVIFWSKIISMIILAYCDHHCDFYVMTIIVIFMMINHWSQLLPKSRPGSRCIKLWIWFGHHKHDYDLDHDHDYDLDHDHDLDIELQDQLWHPIYNVPFFSVAD